ncbi:MAG: bacitracin transporter permease, partial [Paenibacillaceae bacterium]|nr:bacitracin transporter permease [Paenibacillaceae bacterium]
VAILASVIAGTYLFYKGSVRFLFNLIRKSKNGYLSVKEVLSLSSIMFRMRSNALLLTVITTVSALAIGLLSLSYISYTSTETTARDVSPNHFGFVSEKDKDRFGEALHASSIGFREVRIPSIQLEIEASEFIDASAMAMADLSGFAVTLVEDTAAGMDVKPGEALFSAGSSLLNMLSPRSNAVIGIEAGDKKIPLTVTSISKKTVLPMYYGQALVVDGTDFRTISAAAAVSPPKRYRVPEVYYGVDLDDSNQIVAANEIYNDHEESFSTSFSQYQTKVDQRTNMGLIMFIVAFLGLTFLITSGCILYFKQMDESEEEKSGYTILRKLGFTPGDLLSGIRFKQLFNFGIPLVVGLSHSYFAVKSGWFFFGTEMLSPTILVMLVYTGLYSIFGVLSVLYYKRVIGESL